MRLISVTPENYRSFREPTKITAGRNFTVLVGKNNSGKSAALQALSWPLEHQPHKSETSMPRHGDTPPPHSRFSAELEVDGSDIQRISESSKQPIWVPVPQKNIKPVIKDGMSHLSDIITTTGKKPARLSPIWNGGHPFEPPKSYLDLYPVLPSSSGQCYWYIYSSDDVSGTPNCRKIGNALVHNHDLRKKLLDEWKRGIYAFRAERMRVGQCPFGNSDRLHSDASNLPEVLNALQHTGGLFRDYVELVRRVMPEVSWVGVRPEPNQSLKTVVWFGEEDGRRDDLAIELDDCGTGLSQVLAIAYVLATSRQPRLFIVDEPSSFLHPGATSALLEVFREHDHQYVIATHSPATVSQVEPDILHIVERPRHHSKIVTVSHQDSESQRRVLNEVGARLSDVFGPDKIIWVEGPTEERCLPLIIRAKMPRHPTRTAIRPVHATSDFERPKRARRSIALYEKLADGVALLPPALAFFLDREEKSEVQVKELESSLGGKLRLLPRRMFENYLLNPDAIADVLQSESQNVSANDVSEWLRKSETCRLFESEAKVPWSHGVHGAKLLTALFVDLTEARIAYGKVSHGEAITRAILARDPSWFDELWNSLESVLLEVH